MSLFTLSTTPSFGGETKESNYNENDSIIPKIAASDVPNETTSKESSCDKFEIDTASTAGAGEHDFTNNDDCK